MDPAVTDPFRRYRPQRNLQTASAIVAAIQYALLTAPLPAWAKAGVVILGALAASWIAVMALRRVPVTAKLVGG